MINFDEYTNQNKAEHNLKCSYIRDHPYRILIEGSTSRKRNALWNLINNQRDIDKKFFYAKYQHLINKREKVGLNHYEDPKVYWMLKWNARFYEDIQECSLGKKHKVLIVIDDMIADMINNKKLNPVVVELFVRGRKLNISIVFIIWSYFKVLTS